MPIDKIKKGETPAPSAKSMEIGAERSAYLSKLLSENGSKLDRSTTMGGVGGLIGDVSAVLLANHSANELKSAEQARIDALAGVEMDPRIRSLGPILGPQATATMGITEALEREKAARAAELAAAKERETRAYNRGEFDRKQAVKKGYTSAGVGGRPQRPFKTPTDGFTKRVKTAGTFLDTTRYLLKNLDKSYTEKGGGFQTAADFSNWLGRKGLGSEENQAAAAWWQAAQDLKNVERHAMFGSTLSAHEKDEYEKASINPSMGFEQIQFNLARRAAIAERSVARARRVLMSGRGHTLEEAADVIGLPVEVVEAAQINVETPTLESFREAIAGGSDTIADRVGEGVASGVGAAAKEMTPGARKSKGPTPPPKAAIEEVMAKPELREAFEEKYGTGWLK